MRLDIIVVAALTIAGPPGPPGPVGPPGPSSNAASVSCVLQTKDTSML